MAYRVKSKGVVALLQQAVRLIHASEHTHGLVPAQWTALRYFATAAPHQRTAADLARYQNMAVSPVARTVRSLFEKRLICRKPNPFDGRSELIELTSDGRKYLKADPSGELDRLLTALPGDQLAALATALQAVIGGMQTKPAHEANETEN
ncbi:MarR family transcriptional regulator [Azospirillum sp. TSA2s]|uniref:MarR family winged helix-turn-helix transcriptional regulator n=1 Tax=Azospirillum sp. TSA2s TaxID=709810 RepID=UPI0010AB376B|nr:MarR family transcriptional regulator [Azospirillum sp. TSA2s]QCG92709.1 MarR family transcriptional regulator [Azospirillum sp. TSA2s]